MGDEFKIFVHRLKDGQKERIEETLSPVFMDIHEKDLAFNVPVKIHGEAECADQALVLRLHIETEAAMPCAICNENVRVKLEIPDFCHTEEFEDIKGDVFDFKDILREAILLELPSRAECGNGKCPEREALAKFFFRG
ncbi:MAG: hypothetical protein JJU12_02105 [Chlamydiales bacterium]|nr:hypothetical protein [Chlamydiales bacterium]